MVQSSKLSGSVPRACPAQENDYSEHRNARYSSHEHLPNSSNHAVILPAGPARVNGTRVTLASVLLATVAPVLRYPRQRTLTKDHSQQH